MVQWPTGEGAMKKRGVLGIQSLLVLAGFAGAMGCSPKLREPGQEAAPTRSEEAGYIVTASDEELQALSKKYELRYRTLNRSHQLYEIFDLEKEVLVQELPKSKIAKNVVFQTDDLRDSKETMKEIMMEMIQESPKLSPCERDADDYPFAVINGPMGPEKPLLKLNFGESVKLDSLYSRPHPLQYGTPIRSAWHVKGPRFSSRLEEFANGPVISSVLEFTPDSLGHYEVVLVIQDHRNICNFGYLDILITDNPEFTGPQSPRSLDAEEKGKFIQLDLVHADEAWKKSWTLGDGITIAVLDTGVNYNHPDLAANILINSGEIPGNGIDDDGDGRVDDVLGWDFINADNSPFDDDGHGSHVAGIAASPVFGLAPKAKILPIKVLGADGTGDLASIMAGMLYAVERGAKVLNASLGFTTSLDMEGVKEIMKEHEAVFNAIDQAGSILVAAAGNGDRRTKKGLNNDLMPHLPSSFPITNLVAVAALDSHSQLTTYSNFGKMSVHVAAPGGSPEGAIRSTFMANNYNINHVGMNGTSMATPVVAGTLALSWSMNPDLRPESIKDILIQGGESVIELKEKIVSGRRLDALDVVNLIFPLLGETPAEIH